MYASRRDEIWQRLLGLESREIVQMLFEKIHSRKLNARRTAEINSAARQAREYFRNANASDYSVRPLLTYYGVACLARALLLLMKSKGGEEGLTAHHGLEAVGWRNVLNRGVAEDLMNLVDLKVVRRPGLFSDFLIHVRNVTLLHDTSSAKIGYCEFDEPNIEVEISLGDLFSRIPDLRWYYTTVSRPLYASVGQFGLSGVGVIVQLVGDRASEVARVYSELGYMVAKEGDHYWIKCDSSTLSNEPPMFVHAYVDKTIDALPPLKLGVPFPGGARFSQLCITFIMAYALGMLVRYYPTHWISLINGGQGDLLWPTVNRAHHYVESTFPELVAEYVAITTDNPGWATPGAIKE